MRREWSVRKCSFNFTHYTVAILSQITLSYVTPSLTNSRGFVSLVGPVSLLRGLRGSCDWVALLRGLVNRMGCVGPVSVWVYYVGL